MVPRGVLRRVVMLLLAVAVVAPASAATDPDGAREQGPRPDVGTDAPPEPRTRVAPFLTLGAQLEVEYMFARNFDLTDATRDDFSLLTPELQLALSFDPGPRVQVFVNLELSQELALAAPQPEERRLRVGLKEAFLHVKALAPGGLALQVGRQGFKDDREWLYDEELDAGPGLLAAGRAGAAGLGQPPRPLSDRYARPRQHRADHELSRLRAVSLRDGRGAGGLRVRPRRPLAGAPAPGVLWAAGGWRPWRRPHVLA